EANRAGPEPPDPDRAALDELTRLVAPPAVAAPAPAGTSQLPTFGAIMRALEQLGAAAPVALILEDLHWGDPSTLALVRFLTRTRKRQRLLLVWSHRTGDRHAEGRLAPLLVD